MKMIEQAKACKEASYLLGTTSLNTRNQALQSIATTLANNIDKIMVANQQDIAIARAMGKEASFIDRLALDEKRINDIIDGVIQLISLKDPIHQTLSEWDRGELHIKKVSVPIGVIGIIFEARPNVCVDAASLCLKAGNVAFLRGSKDAFNTNSALVLLMQQALSEVNLPASCIDLLQDTSHEAATAFMQMNDYLDLLIPRGGAKLIANAVKNASVPIIETGTGNCHIYVDDSFNQQNAINIIINAKCQRVSVCNAAESLLINKDIADSFLPIIASALKEHGVKIHACERCRAIVAGLIPANEEDYGKEYLDYEISIKIVDNVDEAIKHINKYNTAHSDVIISNNPKHIEQFLNEVDSACVYANASSRFSDGFQFGFGAEIGISTQKIHARGPMGLDALTSYKYEIIGKGTVRK